MALVVYDRVQETTATTGTGTITLGGAVSGYQSFAVVGNGNTTFYCIVNSAQWEVGIGTYSTSGPTLARTTVLSNSNGNTSPITLSGASNVFVTYPSEKSVNLDANGVATIGSVLGYSDTGIIGSFASTVAGYNQVIVQNKSNANNASSNFNVSNDTATATTGYAELGINSSTYTGTGAFNIAGASYLASASTDLAIGTYGAYNIHFATNGNSNTTDAMTIYNSGGVSLGGQPDPGLGTLYANNVYLGFTTITAAAGTTILTNASSGWQQVVGTTTQTIQLPVATTLYKGLAYTVANNSTGLVTIKDNASNTIDTVVNGGTSILVLTANGTSAGTWVAYSYIPSSYDFSASTANFGGATLTNGTWNGTAISSGYGGTGLTTFTAANNALYSTSSSALTAGTLPVPAGGTGATTLTGYVYGNGTSAMTASTTIPTSALSGNFVSTFSAGTTGLTPSTATTGAVTLAGTLGIGNGGTGITSFGTGVQTALGSAVTGSGGIVLATSPTLVTPALGTPTSGNFSTGTFTWPTFNQNTTGSAGSVANAVTFNNGGTGAASGTTYNGSAAQTISYNTVGAAPSGGSTSITSLGTVTAGTWNANVISATYGGTGVAGTLTGISYMNGTSAHTAATGSQISTALGSTAISGQAGSVANALTINNSGTGSASGTTYNGSAAQTISYNSIGASPLAGSSSLTTTGTITSGTWQASTIGVAYGGTGSTSLTANNVLLGNGTSALQVVAPGTSGNVLTSNGTTWVSAAATGGGATISPTTSNTTYYITGTPNTSGSLSTAYISSTNGVSYNASTGALTASSFSGAGTGLTGTASSLTAGAVTGITNQVAASGVDYNTLTTSGFYRMSIGGANQPAGDYGQLLVIHGGYDTITQIYGQYSNGHLYTRSGNPSNVGGGGSWSSWWTVLDSGNYTSYSPSLTGSGASGTWGINVTGSAGSATTATKTSGDSVTSSSLYILPNTGGSANWIFLGTWSCGQSGQKLIIRQFMSVGYNANSAQDCMYDVYFKTSNGGSTQSGSTGAFYGDGIVWRTGPASSIQNLRVVQNNTGSYAVYAYCSNYSGDNSVYEVITSNGTWTNSATLATPSGNYIDLPIYTVLDTSGNTFSGSLTMTGSIAAQSDERLKTNWQDLQSDFVNRLANVKHGTFERIKDGTRDVGVTAQSLQPLLPEAVVEDKDGMLSVNYGGAALAAAIELAKEVKALRAEIAALKAK
jgi:hypothetical protein